MTSQKSFTLSKTNDMSTGVYVFWDPKKGNTPSFVEMGNFGQIAPGDMYSFTLSYNEGDSFDGSDSNSAHQLVECSGRGICDNTQGACVCLPGYTGVACQRTVCPGDCSGHGLCQTELRFASDGLPANLQGYTGYDSDQQYGCKCDKSYRGPDCSSSECPSGPDVLLADGGKEGMDCSGRGLCDYTTGTCQCFKGESLLRKRRVTRRCRSSLTQPALFAPRPNRLLRRALREPDHARLGAARGRSVEQLLYA
jgi:hypothetical protein